MVVSMLSCGALERSNDPYIESIVRPWFSKNQKDIFAVGFDFEGNPEKGWGNGKKYLWVKSGVGVLAL